LPLSADATALPIERGRRQLRGAFAIDLDRIRPDRSQPRQHAEDEAVEQLAASIRRHGIIQAISVRYLADKDMYQIISGERRYHAAKLAGLRSIPCLIHEPAEQDVLVRQIVENWQRAQLHPFQIADALHQLQHENKLSQTDLAEATGKPKAEISKFLKLLDLAPAIQREARADPTGTLSFRHLYNIARLDDPTEQLATAAAVREQKLSALETEHLVRKRFARPAPGRPAGSPLTRIEFTTAKATIVLTFRRHTPDTADILAALDEARLKAENKSTPLNIVRAK